MINDKTPCHKDCFWYNNDNIWNDPLCSCAYYKINIFSGNPRYTSRKWMLEPEACDKYISWDDVELMMRDRADYIDKLNRNI